MTVARYTYRSPATDPLGRVLERIVIGPDSECWIWPILNAGRPALLDQTPDAMVKHRPHALLWEAEHDRPAPRQMRSACDTTGCVNPAHWIAWVGTKPRNHPDTLATAAAYQARRMLDPTFKAEHLAMSRRSYHRVVANPARHEAQKDRRRAWKQSVAGKASTRRSEDARRGAAFPGDVSAEHLAAELERGVCGVCAGPIVDGDATHWDHVVPIAAGGRATDENIRLAHAVCNMVKSDRQGDELAAALEAAGIDRLPSAA